VAFQSCKHLALFRVLEVDALLDPRDELVLEIARADGLAVGQRDDPLERGVARYLAVRLERIGQRPPIGRAFVLERLEHERGGADLEPRGELREVGVADDDVETAEARGVGVRLVARINQGPAVHRVDADQLGEEIGALRNLEAAGAAVVLAFPADLARAGVELARDEERRHGVHEAFPRDDAGDEVVVVAAVAVAAEIGVVLVELDRAGAAARDLARAFLEQALARLVLRDDVHQRGALGRGVLGVGVVVVETRAVTQDQVALDFLEGEFALGVLRVVVGLVGVLHQLLHAKAARVAMRVLGGVVPEVGHAVLRGGADERDRFLDHVGLGIFHDGDAKFSFKAEADGPGRDRRVHGERRVEVKGKAWGGRLGQAVPLCG
jgi:hypothetical protein